MKTNEDWKQLKVQNLKTETIEDKNKWKQKISKQLESQTIEGRNNETNKFQLFFTV